MRRFALLLLPLCLAACEGRRSMDLEKPVFFALRDADKLLWQRGEKLEITFTYECQAIQPVEILIPTEEGFAGGLEIAKPVDGGQPPESHTPDILEASPEKDFSEKITMPRFEVREGGTWDVSGTLEEKLTDEDQVVYIRYRVGIRATPWYRLVCIRKYAAEVETTLGTFNLEFLPLHAPNWVLKFVERAKEGFYDGAPIFHVDKDNHLVFGDATNEETTDLPQETGFKDEGFGTVGMWYRLKPASISHLIFIRFKEREMPMSRFTIFAKVSGGDDVLKKIQAVAVGDDKKPKEDISIVKVTIKEGE